MSTANLVLVSSALAIGIVGAVFSPVSNVNSIYGRSLTDGLCYPADDPLQLNCSTSNMGTQCFVWIPSKAEAGWGFSTSIPGICYGTIRRPLQ